MRTITIILSAVVLSAFLTGGDQAIAKGKAQVKPATAVVTAPSDALPKGFEQSYVWNRVDPALQQAYRDAMTANDPSRRFDCFVRDQELINSGDQDFLISNGFNILSIGGTISSGYLMAQDLPSVASLPFVVNIKLSKPPAGSN